MQTARARCIVSRTSRVSLSKRAFWLAFALVLSLNAQPGDGARLYLANCAGCHGADGDSVAGVDFRSGQFRRVSTDDDLRRTITLGVPGTSMPPTSFTTRQSEMIVAYVRSMRTANAHLGEASATGGAAAPL